MTAVDTNQVWDSVWLKEKQILSKDDPMGLLIARKILEQKNVVSGAEGGLSAIEMGAGPGRTSRYLNLAGLKTGILDISPEALKLARFANDHLPNHVSFFENDLFQLSERDFPEKFDIVWNAGVLEHFEEDQQKTILSRMAQAMREDGVMLVMVPYSRSIMYRLGKAILELLGRFPYGKEVPMHTLKSAVPRDLRFAGRETHFGFVVFLFNFGKMMALLPGLRQVGQAVQVRANRFWTRVLSSERGYRWVDRVDRVLSKIFGGYLLLSTLKRS